MGAFRKQGGKETQHANAGCFVLKPTDMVIIVWKSLTVLEHTSHLTHGTLTFGGLRLLHVGFLSY